MIRLLHVEPNTMVRTVLKDLLGREDVEVVASAVRLGEVPPERAGELGVNLLLVSVEGAENGFDQIRRWRARARGVRVLVLASGDGPEMVAAAVQAGVDGLLATREGPDAVGRAIALVAIGEKVFPAPGDCAPDPGAAAVLAAVLAEGASRRGSRTLAPIERIVLGHLQAGCSNHRIALLTGQHESEVKVQVHAIFRKLKVRNRTQAALWAARNQHLLDGDVQADRMSRQVG